MVNLPIDVNYASIISQTIYWIAYGLIGLLLILGMVAAYFYLTHGIKATVFPLYGSGKDGTFSFGKPKTNKVKWTKKKTAWKSLFPLFNNKNREPFDQEYIYPGNRIYVFEINGEWIPGRININASEEKIRAEINPVPYYVRNWMAAEDKIDDSEFAREDFWTNNKMLIMTIIAVGICCALAGLTIYLTYQFAAPGASAMNNLATALNGFGNIGTAPLG